MNAEPFPNTVRTGSAVDPALRSMTPEQTLAVSIGQYSESGQKERNQDFFGAIVPEKSVLANKGIAIAIADGIGSSPVSHVAAETAVKSFLTDYYCTSDAWTVKTAAHRVIAAINSWLHAETRRAGVGDMDRGYVTTFSVMIVKGLQAHIFHVGDCRVSRICGGALERLTQDHRLILSSQQNYLTRALGMQPGIEIDYTAIRLRPGDIFMLASDGVYEHVDDAAAIRAIADHADDLDEAARTIAKAADANGSTDDRTVQLARIESLPGEGKSADMAIDAGAPPAPAIPQPGDVFDGWRILRSIKGSSRSHLFEAEDTASGAVAVLKVPSLDMREDSAYLRRFLMEEWVARRVSHRNLLKAHVSARPRSFLYTAMELVQGQTLGEWMAANPAPEREQVVAIVRQIADALQAMHRRDMVHLDVRPENVMIRADGLVTVIDFGSVSVGGIEEADTRMPEPAPGTYQYAAPEYLIGDMGTPRCDVYSLGVIAYQLFTGALPYGAEMARARIRAAQRRVRYLPATGENSRAPDWVDAALRKAVHADPSRRYQEVAEFVEDLQRPNPSLPGVGKKPFAERNPVRFWQIVSLLLAFVLIASLAERFAP